MKRRKNKRSLIFFLSAIIVAIGAFSFYYGVFHRPISVSSLGVKFSVGSRVGVVIEKNSSVINFGKVMRNSHTVKEVYLENDYDSDLIAKVFVEDKLAGFIKSDKKILIPKGQRVKIPFHLVVSPVAEVGNYSGRIILEYWKA